jgi:transcriptional regulator with PAS, ATPase and Fis domain
MGILVVDAAGRVLFMNQHLELLTGARADRVVGLPCALVLRSRCCVQQCTGSRPAARGRGGCRQDDILARDRRRIPVRITTTPLLGSDGQRLGAMESIEDLRPVPGSGPASGGPYSFGDIIGQSPQMERLFAMLPVVAQSDASVLITGETGTGKDLLAEALHQASERAKGPFVKINCGALPATLLESELFGHQKGAFTGAVEDRPGRFRMAHRGTLYLTEIGDLPTPLQVKLLTFLDDKIVYPLGSAAGYPADVRVVAATHRNLEDMVRRGRFRQDLFYRLNVLRLEIPPLRSREGDIRLLLDHYLKRLSVRLGRTIEGFAGRCLKILLHYDYPGNVRELKNIVEYCANLCQERRVQPRHLPAYLTDPARPAATPRPSAAGSPPLLPARKDPASPPGERIAERWRDVEVRMIREALVQARGNRSRAAAMLGCSRSTLWRKIRQFGIEV